MFKNQVIKELEAYYPKLGYREKKVLEKIAIRPFGEEIADIRYIAENGTVTIGMPGGGSFEVAWDLPGYERGTVVG